MANITITNIDNGSVVLKGDGWADGTLRNAAGAPATFVEGTILARHATDGKFYPYDPAEETEDLGVAKAVLTYDVGPVAATSDVGVRVLTAGEVNQRRLRIHDGTTITAAHLDGLRDFAIVPSDVVQLAKVDNPQ